MKKELKEVMPKLTKLKDDQKENIDKYSNIEVKIDKLYKLLDYIKKTNDELVEIKKDKDSKEKEYQLFKKYENFIGPKGLQLKILRNKLSKLSNEMNGMLKKHTKYSIQFDYNVEDKNVDDITKIDANTNKKTKQNKKTKDDNNDDHEKTNDNKKLQDKYNYTIYIKVKSEDNKYLSIERLSAYETLILSASFKRALGRHTNRTRSKLYIIDEILECTDNANFEKALPELIKFIQEEYPYILLISQRDVKHLSD